MTCCPIIDGGTGPTPPPPTPACANEVIVQALADLPAPVGSSIPLSDDTFYRICGRVLIGALSLDLPPTSVIAGADPLVDGLASVADAPAILMSQGGTVKDLSVSQTSPVRPASGSAIQIGEVGSLVESAVVFNVSGRGEEAAIKIAGQCRMVSIARVFSMNSTSAVKIGDTSDPAQVLSLSLDQIVAANSGSQFVGVEIGPGSGIDAMSLSLSAFTGSTPADFGIRTASTGLIATLRVSSCAYFGPGTPSIIAQGLPLPPGNTGTARNSEAVGCVGFLNSRTRGAIQIVQAFTPTTGALTPVGTPAGPTYTLSPGESRFVLDGATGPTQSLRYTGFSPADLNVTGYLSFQVAAGFSFTPRIVIAAIFIDRNDGLGFVQAGPAFGSTTPTFSSAAPGFVAVSEGLTVSENDRLQIRIANLTDLDPLQVVAARLVIGED